MVKLKQVFLLVILTIISSFPAYAEDEASGYFEVNPELGYSNFNYSGNQTGSSTTLGKGLDLRYGQIWSPTIESFFFIDGINYGFNNDTNTLARFGLGVKYNNLFIDGLSLGITLGMGESLITYLDENNNLVLSKAQTATAALNLAYKTQLDKKRKINIEGSLVEISDSDYGTPLEMGVQETLGVFVENVSQAEPSNSWSYGIKYSNTNQNTLFNNQNEKDLMLQFKFHFRIGD